jgi:polyisoprenoid-binding protein YceI
MHAKRIFLALLMGLFLVSGSFAADSFTIDPVHSNIGFSVRHMAVSNVKGRFTEFTGTIVYDAADMTKSSVDVVIRTASVNTDNVNRDNDLKGSNYLDATKFPEVTFKSTRIEKRGEGFVAVGSLAIHGVSKEISIPFSILGKTRDARGKVRLGAEGGVTIDRRDFGITISRALDGGGLVVGNEVKIELEVEAGSN